MCLLALRNGWDTIDRDEEMFEVVGVGRTRNAWNRVVGESFCFFDYSG